MIMNNFTREKRKKQLKDLFKEKTLKNTWRDVVKSQIRHADIKDIYDHYDFFYNIESQAEIIRRNIINGNYQVSQPLIYKIEKKHGICRHLVVPQPVDALILQVITDHISDDILKNQPSKNTYHTRDKNNFPKFGDISVYGMHWSKLWVKLQRTIFKFIKKKGVLVVTDLSNYYDSINMDELKKNILQFSDKKDAYIDLLFKIVEGISWLTDYQPYSRRGLPTANFEGIRLLGYSFLFELDVILGEMSNESFTRWMDDIVIAAKSKKEAVNILSLASDVLKSKGLALNTTKTNIYDTKQAKYHFQIDANKYLDNIDYEITKVKEYTKLTSELNKNFIIHLKDTAAQYWEKVSKRYIIAFGRLKSEKLLNKVAEIYNEHPGLRKNLLIYLSKMGYNKKTSDTVLEIIDNLYVHDDVSMFEVCNLVTDWEISETEDSTLFLKKFESKIIKISVDRKGSFDFFCLLWFKAKYSHPSSLLKFLQKYEYIWNQTSFLKRQVTAILPRLFVLNDVETIDFLTNLLTDGDLQTITLANQVLDFRGIQGLNRKLRSYLFPDIAQSPYPLSKFIILCNLLTSEGFRTNNEVINKVKAIIHDPYYKKWIAAFYNIS